MMSASADRDRVFRRFVWPFRVLLVASAFAFFWVGGSILAWTALPAIRLFARDRCHGWRLCQRLVKQSFRVFHGYMRILGLFRVEAATPLLPAGSPLVLIANHPTLVDVTALLSRIDDVCCLVKPSLMKSPFIGPLLRCCGHIDGGKDALSGSRAMVEAESRLAEGFHVLVFPEGTRSPIGGLHPFRRGGFEVAARAGTGLLPLYLTCEPPALMKGRPFWLHPMVTPRLLIRAGDVVDMGAWMGKTRSLTANVEAQYRAKIRGASDVQPSTRRAA